MTAEIVREVVDAETIQSRVAQLGAELTRSLNGEIPVMVSILNGSFMFFTDLARAMDCNVELDFLSLSSFGGETRVNIQMDVSTDVTDRHVVIVEDIIDTGMSLAYLREVMSNRGAASVRTVALLDKVKRRIVNVPVELRGFEVGEEHLLGYGLDWEGRFRGLPSLWAVLDIPAFQDDPEVLAVAAYDSDRLRT